MMGLSSPTTSIVTDFSKPYGLIKRVKESATRKCIPTDLESRGGFKTLTRSQICFWSQSASRRNGVTDMNVLSVSFLEHSPKPARDDLDPKPCWHCRGRRTRFWAELLFPSANNHVGRTS